MIPGVVPGFSLHEELSLMVDAGLSPLQALQTATLRPAEFLGRSGDMGTVEVGKVADLVLLDGDPTKDLRSLSRISGVFSQGRWMDRAALNALLSTAKAAAMVKNE